MRRVFIPWAVLNDGLAIQYLRPPDEVLRSDFTHQQDRWLQAVEECAGVLSAAEGEYARNTFLESYEAHWALENVLKHNLDVATLSGILNEYGMRQAVGPGVHDIREEEDGVVFQLLKPFVQIYAASRECQRINGDLETALKGLSNKDIVETFKHVLSCLGYQGVNVDLTGWDAERELPSVHNLVKRITWYRNRDR